MRKTVMFAVGVALLAAGRVKGDRVYLSAVGVMLKRACRVASTG